jgi:hypothetical protein
VRPKDTFEETTGEAAVRMGPKDFQDLVDSADGGCLFIDEAHAIMDGDPKTVENMWELYSSGRMIDRLISSGKMHSVKQCLIVHDD